MPELQLRLHHLQRRLLEPVLRLQHPHLPTAALHHRVSTSVHRRHYLGLGLEHLLRLRWHLRFLFRSRSFSVHRLRPCPLPYHRPPRKLQSLQRRLHYLHRKPLHAVLRLQHAHLHPSKHD